MLFHPASLRGLRATLGAAGLMAASAAYAAPALPAAMLVTPAGVAVGQSAACGPVIAPEVVAAPAYTARRAVSPSRAILGGEMSALERIRMQQEGAQTETRVVQQRTAFQLEPAASGVRIKAKGCRTDSSRSYSRSAAMPLPTGRSNDFLASQRLPISRTSFDSDWRRVSNESLSGTMRIGLGAKASRSMRTIESINRYVNRSIAYVEDRELFGRADYWAGARLTLALGRGDCEDIALTKMQMLAAAGFDREDMFLTIARDTVRRADHALLVVRIDGRFVVLDNATDVVLDGAFSHDYQPVLSFSANNSWIHGY